MIKDFDLYNQLVSMYNAKSGSEEGYKVSIKTLCFGCDYAFTAALNNKLIAVRQRYARLREIDNMLQKYMQYELTRHQLNRELTPNERSEFMTEINKCEVLRSKVRHTDRNMQVLYITGSSGSGKTTLAKYLADKISNKRGDITFNLNNSEHPFDGYDGECCCVWNDVRGNSNFSADEWLQLLDNHTNAKQGARYHDVDLFNVRLMILTSVDSMDEFIRKAARNEDKVQFYRRLGWHYLEIDTRWQCVYDINCATGERKVFMTPAQFADMMKQMTKKDEAVDDIMKELMN